MSSRFIGAQALTPKEVCRKLSRRKSWLWQRIKSDPTFPRPIYLSPSAPIFIEGEIDAWLAALAERVCGASASGTGGE